MDLGLRVLGFKAIDALEWLCKATLRVYTLFESRNPTLKTENLQQAVVRPGLPPRRNEMLIYGLQYCLDYFGGSLFLFLCNGPQNLIPIEGSLRLSNPCQAVLQRFTSCCPHSGQYGKNKTRTNRHNHPQ